MSVLDRLTNLLLYMLELLTSAYNKTDEYNIRNGLPLSTNIGKLFASFGWGLEIIQSNAELVRLWANIDNAKGAVLDRYGANYGVDRGGANDVFYRLMIKIKILAQISGGDIETIIGAVAGLYEIDATGVELYEIFPAKIQIAIYEDALPDQYDGIKDLVGMLTKRLLMAGVGLDMIYKEEDVTNGNLYIGGCAVTEYSRIGLEDRYQEIPQMTGQLYVGGGVAAELVRVRLEPYTQDIPTISGTLHTNGMMATEATRIRLAINQI